MANILLSRYRAIVGYIGLMSCFAGVTILLPLLTVIFYPEDLPQSWGYGVTGLGLAIAGFAAWRLCTTGQALTLSIPEGSVIVLGSWLLAILASTIPFSIHEGLTFSQALFESTSGWTTTGLSVVDVTEASHLTLMFRSTIELVGGAGLAIVTLGAMAGPIGSGLSTAEGRTDKLAPNVRQSAKLVLSIYSGYVAVGILGLHFAGMGWFDAINHAFAALSTGGFSTRTDSIGYWDNPVIEFVTIVLMILGTINFLTSYLILNRQFKPVFRNGELRLMAVLTIVATAILMLGGVAQLYPSLGKGLRVALFESISALSTTGFSTVGYLDWNSLGWFLMISLMLIGGGAGSTAGGIKQARIYTIYRAVLWEIKRALLPRNAVTEPDTWQGRSRHFLDDTSIRHVALFIFLYLFTFAIGCGIMAAYGYPLPDCLFEMASTLSTVGLSVGVTSADAPEGLLWMQSVGMILGRLEFMAVFVGIMKIVQDIFRQI